VAIQTGSEAVAKSYLGRSCCRQRRNRGRGLGGMHHCGAPSVTNPKAGTVGMSPGGECERVGLQAIDLGEAAFAA
jgi:hypothetical protein